MMETPMEYKIDEKQKALFDNKPQSGIINRVNIKFCLIRFTTGILRSTSHIYC